MANRESNKSVQALLHTSARFLIANTFTESLAKLTGDEQKAAKTTVFDLQADLSHPGLDFHRVEKSKDPDFWSVRVSRDVRIIVHRSAVSTVLCYVDHHDDAYQWAERRKLETHPKTGAAQLVEVRETIQEITVPRAVETMPEVPTKPPLFAGISDDALSGYGVPDEWLGDVRAADEERFLDLAEHLPEEAVEALLELAGGDTPQAARPPSSPPSLEASDSSMGTGEPAEYGRTSPSDPFEHPDAQRRFRVVHDVAELERALSNRWAVFLDRVQRYIVEGDFSGSARRIANRARPSRKARDELVSPARQAKNETSSVEGSNEEVVREFEVMETSTGRFHLAGFGVDCGGTDRNESFVFVVRDGYGREVARSLPTTARQLLIAERGRRDYDANRFRQTDFFKRATGGRPVPDSAIAGRCRWTFR